MTLSRVGKVCFAKVLGIMFPLRFEIPLFWGVNFLRWRKMENAHRFIRRGVFSSFVPRDIMREFIAIPSKTIPRISRERSRLHFHVDINTSPREIKFNVNALKKKKTTTNEWTFKFCNCCSRIITQHSSVWSVSVTAFFFLFLARNKCVLHGRNWIRKLFKFAVRNGRNFNVQGKCISRGKK